MHIEFDANKNDINIRDRGLSFELVESFDFDCALIWQDLRKPYPEARFTALGCLMGACILWCSLKPPKAFGSSAFAKPTNAR